MNLFKPNINKMIVKGDLKGLINCLVHKDDKIRKSSTEAIQVLSTARNFTDLTRSLGREEFLILINKLDDTSFLQTSAKILQIAGDLAVPTLISVLEKTTYTREGVTGNVARILGFIGNPIAINVLIKGLNSTSFVGENVVFGLTKFGNQILEPLKNVIMTGSTYEQEMAVRVLGELKSLEAKEELISVVCSRYDLGVVYKAMEYLTKLGLDVVPSIHSVIKKSENQEARARLCRVLGRIKSSDSLDLLLEILKSDQDKDVLNNACEALGEIGDTRALKGLVNALDDNRIRYNALVAIQKLNHPDSLPVITGLLSDPFEVIRERAANILRKFGETKLIDAINEMRKGNIDAILKLHDIRVIPLLLSSLSTNDQKYQKQTLEVLDQLGEHLLAQAFMRAFSFCPTDLVDLNDERSLYALRNIVIHGPHETSRNTAAFALGQIDQGLNILFDLYKIPSKDIQKSVIFGLGKSKSPDAYTFLMNQITSSEDNDIQFELAKALGEYRDPQTVRIIENLYKQKGLPVTILGCISEQAFINKLHGNPELMKNSGRLIWELPINNLINLFIIEKDKAFRYEILWKFFGMVDASELISHHPKFITEAGNFLLQNLEEREWNRKDIEYLLSLGFSKSLDIWLLLNGEITLGLLKRWVNKTELVDEHLIKKAVISLCEVYHPLTTTILQLFIEKFKAPFDLNLEYQGASDYDASYRTVHFDFSELRQVAESELKKRGNPQYNATLFINCKGVDQRPIDIALQLYGDYLYNDIETLWRTYQLGTRNFINDSLEFEFSRELSNRFATNHPDIVGNLVREFVYYQHNSYYPNSHSIIYEKLLVQACRNIPKEKAFQILSPLKEYPLIYDNVVMNI